MSTEETPASQAGPTGPDGQARGAGQARSTGPAWGVPLLTDRPTGAPLEVPTQVDVRPHWPARKVIGAVAIAVVLVGGGTAAAIAATQPATTPRSSAGVPSQGGSGGTGGGSSRSLGRGGDAAGTLNGALHGDFVVQTNTGGYATERLQTGKVTKVSSTSISLTSADGYAGSYAVTTATLIDKGATKISEVRTGDTVTVLAAVSGNTATAATLTDADKVPSGSGTSTGGGSSAGGSGTPGGMQPNDSGGS